MDSLATGVAPGEGDGVGEVVRIGGRELLVGVKQIKNKARASGRKRTESGRSKVARNLLAAGLSRHEFGPLPM
jgi:hypothetical protein